ncbi:MAG TPA: glycosyltransferase family 1 protein [Anaerolineae bacterium]|nr:glycosyltransferase family 4 protein [Caldilineae bacterium]HID35183.1 glycosyltransferase family 1 protein [Anaerolineae bacterium]HIQ11731.1 glycosyltransferase family 1 protein [Caldilineales bacterium]
MTTRILYIDLAPRPGGSIISLAHLVKGLDRTRWQPMVILSQQNAFADFEAMGIDVARVRTPQWEGLTAGKQDHGGEERPAKEGGAGAWMRRGAYRARLWHLGGDLRRWRRDILPVTRALMPFIRAFRPHLIHLNDAIPLVRHGILAAKWTRTPVINHSRAFVPLNALDRRWLLPSLRGMIFISQAVARAQLQGVASPPRHRVIPNPVDLSAFRHPSHPAQVRREFGVPPDAPLIGMAGRITRWKGQHVFIEALASLRQRFPQAHGLILGEAGSARDQAYRRALQARSRELGLEAHLHWAGHRADIPRILPALDALAHCSVEPEPFGRVIIEGMAAGVPVTASAAGGALEIIEEGVNGLLTRPGDANALAAALTRVLHDASLRDRLIENGWRTVAERYTIEKHVAAVTEFYELALSDMG